jgi:hypothetical protein
MTDREQSLIRKTALHFSAESQRLRDEITQLWRANAELRVERDVTDLLLGEAIALLHQVGDSRW